MISKRNFGLDLIRIFAAFLVIICHAGYFSIGLSLIAESFAGILAVDFFFVLSGLLVGKSMILAITDHFPGKMLKCFYINRIFRTLPFYYVMLFINAWLTGESIPLSYFLFLHNFTGDLGFMPVTWSLSIEIWFYFAIPPVFLLLFRVFQKTFSPEKAVFCALGILYCIPFLLRIVWVVTANPEWDAGVRKQVFLRMDALILGVLFSALKLYHPEYYRKIASHKASLMVSLVGLLLSWLLHKYYYFIDGHYDTSVLSRIFAFTLLPQVCMLLVLHVENSSFLEMLKKYRFTRIIPRLSALTYGIYLLHFPIFGIVGPRFQNLGFAENWLGFMGTTLITILLAQIAYWLIELPAEKLRNRVLINL